MEPNHSEKKENPAESEFTPVPALLPHLVEPVVYADDANPATLTVRALNTPDSRRTMEVSLGRLAAICSGDRLAATEFPWARLRYTDTSKLRRELANRYEPAGANVKLSALRSVLRQAWRLELIDREAFERAADVANIPGDSDLAGRRLEIAELRALARVCADDHSVKGARDASILALLARTGIRRAEIVRPDLRHLDLAAGKLQIRGKGARRRSVDVVGGARETMERWLGVRGRRQGPLYWRVDRHGNLHRARLSTWTIADICHDRAEQAGIARLTPHDLRRTFTTAMLESGEDVFTVSGILGHSKIDTTRRYDHRGDETRRSAMERLDAAFS